MNPILRNIICLCLAALAGLLFLSGCGKDTLSQPTLPPAPTVAADPQRLAAPHPAESGFAGGSGTAEDPYRIATAGQLACLSQLVNENASGYSDACYILTADITLNDAADFENWDTTAPEHSWDPIGGNGFRGSFDGNGYVIRGLYIYDVARTAGSAAGLFGKVKDGTVQNVILEDAYICSAADCVGGIAGSINGGEIRGCVFSGSLRSTTDEAAVGGILGNGEAEKTALLISGCENRGSVHALDHAGGILGYLSAGQGEKSVLNCENHGDIHSDEQAGGILGTYFGSDVFTSGDTPAFIEKCTNHGSVNAKTAGGIAGAGMMMQNTVHIRHCVNHGDIHGGNFTRAGGILGTDAVASMVTTEEYPAFHLNACVNFGNIYEGNGLTAFDRSYEGSGIQEKFSADEATFVLMGENCIGGIAGRISQSILEDCVNCGALYGKENTLFLTDFEALSFYLNNEDATYSGATFAGGICGLYSYVGDNTLENSGLWNCLYPDTIPAPYSDCGVMGGADSIRDIRDASLEDCVAAAENLP